jgi:hypothetical protein
MAPLSQACCMMRSIAVLDDMDILPRDGLALIFIMLPAFRRRAEAGDLFEVIKSRWFWRWVTPI